MSLDRECQVRLAGRGGQGVVLAGLLLAEAAVQAGRNATHSQAFGPESRGGASKADVIVADGPIDYLVATRLDVLVALSQEALDVHLRHVRPGGLVLVDSDHVAAPPFDPSGAALQWHALPITSIARQQLGTTLGANLLALGALVALTELVPPEAMERAIAARWPGAAGERGLRAFRAGLALAGGRRSRDYIREVS